MWSKTCWFIIDRWMREKALWSYQRFQYIHIWSYIIRCGKKYFVVTVCKLLEQHKNWNVILEIVLTLMVNKLLRCLRRVNISNSKIQEGKKKRHSRFMQISKAFQCLKIMKSETQMSFIAKNIKNMLLVVMVINWYELMINLESLLNHT